MLCFYPRRDFELPPALPSSPGPGGRSSSHLQPLVVDHGLAGGGHRDLRLQPGRLDLRKQRGEVRAAVLGRTVSPLGGGLWPQSGPLESLRVVNVGEGWRKRERATTWCVLSAFPRPSGHEVLYFEPPNTPGLMEMHHKKRCPLSASVPKNYRAPRGIPVHHSPSPKRIPCAVQERIQPWRCGGRRGRGTADPNQLCPRGGHSSQTPAWCPRTLPPDTHHRCSPSRHSL